MENITELKEKFDVESNFEKARKKLEFDDEPIKNPKESELLKVGIASASSSAPISAEVVSRKSLTYGEEVRAHTDTTDDDGQNDNEQDNDDNDEMDDTPYIEFLNRKRDRERDGSSSGSPVEKVKKRTKTTNIFSSDDSNDTIVNVSCHNRASTSTSFDKNESTSRSFTSKSSTEMSKASTNTGSSSISGTLIKLRKKSDTSKVKSIEEDPEGDERFEVGILREKDVLDKIPALKLSEQTLTLMRELEACRFVSSNIKGDIKARMGNIITDVIDSISVLTSRIGYTGDPEYIRKRLRTCEITNSKLLAENNALKEENVKLLGKLNRHERREVKFSKSKKVRDIDSENESNRGDSDNIRINDNYNKNKTSRNINNNDFPQLPQKTLKPNTIEKENFTKNRNERSEVNYYSDAREPIDECDDLKRIELQNRNRYFTREIVKCAAERRLIEYGMRELNRNRENEYMRNVSDNFNSEPTRRTNTHDLRKKDSYFEQNIRRDGRNDRVNRNDYRNYVTNKGGGRIRLNSEVSGVSHTNSREFTGSRNDVDLEYGYENGVDYGRRDDYEYESNDRYPREMGRSRFFRDSRNDVSNERDYSRRYENHGFVNPQLLHYRNFT